MGERESLKSQWLIWKFAHNKNPAKCDLNNFIICVTIIMEAKNCGENHNAWNNCFALCVRVEIADVSRSANIIIQNGARNYWCSRCYTDSVTELPKTITLFKSLFFITSFELNENEHHLLTNKNQSDIHWLHFEYIGN